MAFQYFILVTILFADLSKSDDSCSQALSCLEPLEQYDTFSKFIPGPDLNNEFCREASEVFDCMTEHLRACKDNAVVVAAEVIMNELGYLCHSPVVLEDLRDSYCLQEPARGAYIENLRTCFSKFHYKANLLVEGQMYCKAAKGLQYCPQRAFGACGESFQAFYEVLFQVHPTLRTPNGEECYGEYLAADFIKNRMVAGSES